MLTIKNGLEPLWDDYLVDEKTTAQLSVNHAVRKEKLFSCDMPWEGDGSDYFCVLPDDGLFRMYYLGWKTLNGEGIHVCYAESKDGLHWTRPSLGIYDYKGSKDNNILFGPKDRAWDNFYVMKDENPACPPERRYKAVAMWEFGKSLMCLTSPDGIHFEPYKTVSRDGAYDSLNTLHWNPHTGKYYVFFRGFHKKEEDPTSNFNEGEVRDISVIESVDFESWSEPRYLDFCGGDDYPLYTNCVSAYPGNDRIYVGFPTRYVERKKWDASFERLCGKESRQNRMKTAIRYGLAITECVFMFSRDLYHWKRFEEAFIRPGPENPMNWVYGDGYPATGLLETAAELPGEDNEYSFILDANHWSDLPADLYRYTVRKDGFASYKADYKGKRLVTKPFTMEADRLAMNFSTSARGGITVGILDEEGNPIEGYQSCEQFGDSVKRVVDFEKPLSALKGKPIRLSFEMRDGELFALHFLGEEN